MVPIDRSWSNWFRRSCFSDGFKKINARNNYPEASFFHGVIFTLPAIALKALLQGFITQ